MSPYEPWHDRTRSDEPRRLADSDADYDDDEPFFDTDELDRFDET